MNNVGVAAHIHAAAPGGARYLKEMTPEQRKDLANGVWLCNICSRDVDNDAKRYPAELLRDWRQQAEERARSRLGQAPIEQRDVQDQMRMVFGSAPSSFQLAAVSNVHLSLAHSMEQMDPRFRVETSYVSGKTIFDIRAKQPVPLAFRVVPHMADEFRSQLTRLVNHGEPVSLDGGAATVIGSPLFEHLTPSPESAKFRIDPRCIPAVLKVTANHPQTGEPFFEEFRGDVMGGSQSFTFKGQACDGMLTISLRHSFSGEEPPTSFSIELDDARWAQRDVNYLPHFESIYQLFETMSRGNDLDIRLLMDGLQVLHLKFTVTKRDDYIDGMSNALRYLKRARIVGSLLERSVQYVVAYMFSAEEHLQLHEVAQIAEGLRSTSEDPKAVATIVLGEDVTLSDLTDPSTPHLVKFLQNEGAVLDIYGQPIPLPPLELALDNVFAEVLSEQQEHTSGVVEIAWRPAKDFTCVYSYLKDPLPSGTPSDAGR
ncbi:hypothetical protein [Aquabacterium sp.]|uniref:hypothetical protein n=1 Tax=Aquabacterium sp. TaxID=1872578 RepID=UPI0019C4DE61|nr:hypothetical protein [Aquabacterium sp.]MBC7699348.1 hypothetical protein [Aquabacterium sp.]